MNRLNSMLTLLLLLSMAGVLAAAESAAKPVGEAALGTEGTIFVRYQHQSLAAKPIDEHSPLWVRIVGSTPKGASSIYEVRFQAMRAGQFDVRDYLTCAAGPARDELSPLIVNIRESLPADHDGSLAEVALPQRGFVWPYRAIVGGLFVVWLLGTGIFFIRWLRSRPKRQVAATIVPEALVDPLPPLVELALAGKLPPAGQARLEMLLIDRWRDRLQASDAAPHDAHEAAAQSSEDAESSPPPEMFEFLESLRNHEEGGQLLRALESWLHARPDARCADIENFLRPYLTVSTASANHSSISSESAAPCQPD